jgi:homoserine dehydrogenase
MFVPRHPVGGARYGAGHHGRTGPVIPHNFATSEDAVYRALEKVQRDKVISGRPQVIRIEKN